VFEVIPSVGVFTRLVDPEVFNLSVKFLTGKTIRLSVSEDTSVVELKSMIQGAEGYPPDQQRLVYPFKDSWKVIDHGKNSPLAVWYLNGPSS
jgi:Ubiquitin family